MFEIRVHRSGVWETQADLGTALAAAHVTVDETGHSSIKAAHRGSGREPFVWVVAHNPTHEQIEQLVDILKPPRRARSDFLSPNGHVTVDVFENTVYLSARSLTYHDDTSEVQTGHLQVVALPRVLILIEYGEGRIVADSLATVMDPEFDLSAGIHAIMRVSVSETVRTYTQVDQDLADDVADLETLVFSSHRRADPSEKIYSLKREVAETRRALLPLVGPLRDLASGAEGNLPDEIRGAARRLGEITLRVLQHIDSYDQLLGDMLSAHLALVGVQQNTDMRKISAWGAIALVPTIIGSLYGMNFHNIPGLDWDFGYLICLGVITLTCYVLFRVFKRSGWL